MATILLSAAGAALGSGFGGTVLGLSGSVIGRAIGATVGRSIDQRILGGQSDATEVGRVDRFRLSGVGYGLPVNEVWGRMRVAGEIIWASRFLQSVRKSGGGKGVPRSSTETFSYTVSLAIALCRGEASSVGRIWADGVEIAKNSLNLRFYPGNEDQLPDPKIEAVEGAGMAPTYRGMCYVVIESLQLSRFGNRIPQFSFEVIRSAQGGGANAYANVQQSVRAVAMIPGSGEYALATTPVRFDLAPGRSRTANMHTVQGISDFQVSLDQLTDELPNCQSVSLVVSWFGDDLRCGHCTIQPKVEQALTDSAEMPWQVSGVSRSSAAIVPYVNGRPVYGGTPTDRSVIEAIQAIRATGQEVMFYPFILMDQSTGNTLPDPWSDADTQPTLPWRGRMTLERAPGLSGTTDQTPAAAVEVGAFLGAATISDFSASGHGVSFAHPAQWGYRRFILHYAHLCALAGGVDAFCIGSELRGLTQIRSASNTFPMVAALRQLAAEVKAILGSATKVSYAADWSEYFGYHVGENVLFNLDPLWSDPNIDFIGIDNYMPISDWRDGPDNLDAAFKSIYNIDYLLLNVAGGEGYHWYYDSSEGELHQNRREIRDLAFGEDWIYRYKDIKGWWSNDHHDRIAGVRSAAATSWQPGMKPIRFTEYGCAALDKATNQPNKFIDAKSSESTLPRASSGQRDDFIQMQYLRAMATFWGSAENNPQANLYAGRMLDFDHSHVWAWDARPFPEFPGNVEEWSDGDNYFKGHWLNGRSTNQQLAAVIAELCRDLDPVKDFDVSQIYQVVRGHDAASSGSARSKLQSLSLAYAFDVAEIDGTLTFFQRLGMPIRQIDTANLVASDTADQNYEQVRAADASMVGRVRLTYIEAENDFEVKTVEAVFPDDTSKVVSETEFDLLLAETEARAIVERWLAEARLAKDTTRFTLPKSALGLNSGDVVSIFGGTYRIDSVEDAEAMHIDASRVDSGAYLRGTDTSSGPLRVSPVPPSPLFATFLDLPLLTGSENPQSPHIAVTSDPWPGTVGIWSSPSDSGYTLNTTVQAPAILGILTSELQRAEPDLWDRGSRFTAQITSGELSSVAMIDVLNGANVAAIGDGSPENWEVVQFANATLVAPDTYELSMLLRGLLGSDATSPASWPVGSLFVVIDSLVPQINLPFASRGLERFYRVGVAETGYTDPNVSLQTLAFNGIGLRPFSVSHLTASRQIDNSVIVNWIRRSRIDGDSWQSTEVPLGEETERYTVRVMSSSVVAREFAVTSPAWTYTTEMQLADGMGSSFTIAVAQDSTSFGHGPFNSVSVDA